MNSKTHVNSKILSIYGSAGCLLSNCSTSKRKKNMRITHINFKQSWNSLEFYIPQGATKLGLSRSEKRCPRDRFLDVSRSPQTGTGTDLLTTRPRHFLVLPNVPRWGRNPDPSAILLLGKWGLGKHADLFLLRTGFQDHPVMAGLCWPTTAPKCPKLERIEAGTPIGSPLLENQPSNQAIVSQPSNVSQLVCVGRPFGPRGTSSGLANLEKSSQLSAEGAWRPWRCPGPSSYIPNTPWMV